MSEKRFVSVGARLAASTAAVISVFSLAAFFGLSQYQWQTLVEGRAASARQVMSLFAELVAAPLVFEDEKGIEEGVKYVLRNPDLLFARVTSVDAGAKQKVAHQYIKPGVGREEQITLGSETIPFDDRVVVTSVVKDTDGKVIGGATLSFALTSEIAAYARLRMQILFGALAIALVLILVLVVVARKRVVNPLAALTTAVQKLEQGEAADVAASANDEVGLLAGAFGRMAEAIRQREQQIARRNRDMKLVLDNVGQGFVIIDRAACVAGERSATADRWFSAPTKGQLVADWLAPHDANFRDRFALAWEQLIDGFMPRELCLDQLPRRLVREATTGSIEYKVISDDTQSLAQMMLVITDVTAELAREAAEQIQHELVEIFQRLGRDRSGFLEFVQDGRRIVELLGQEKSLSEREHFRLVHTLKGNSAIQGIHSVAITCHAIETRLADERGRITAEESAAISAVWTDFEGQVERLSGSHRNIVEVEEALVRDLADRIARGRPHSELQQAMARWSQESVRSHLERLAERATSLAFKLGKGEPQVEVQCDDTRLSPGSFSGFWSALVHVVRNAVDHGLETRTEPGQRGGRLTFGARESNGVLEVVIADNGRGIAWEDLAKKAAARGLKHTTQADLVEALFADGVSTRDTVSETSGRGVGLSAVRNEVEQAGGSVTVESKRGEGTRFVFRLPIAQGVGRHAA
jgi:two-component system chemotaxis sensor kinase CheA